MKLHCLPPEGDDSRVRRINPDTGEDYVRAVGLLSTRARGVLREHAAKGNTWEDLRLLNFLHTDVCDLVDVACKYKFSNDPISETIYFEEP